MSVEYCGCCDCCIDICDCIIIRRQFTPPKGWELACRANLPCGAITNSEGTTVYVEPIALELQAVLGDRTEPKLITIHGDRHRTGTMELSFDVIEYLLAERERITEGK